MKKFFITAAAALALVAAGCGGDSDESSSASPTDEWAEDFCTAITTWTDARENITEQFTDASSLTRDNLEDAANDAKSATETLVDDLRALGAPDTESGQAVEDSVDELSNTLDTEVAKIEDAVEDASGLTGLPTAISSIATSVATISAALASIQQTIEDANPQGELETAFEDSPACSDLSS